MELIYSASRDGFEADQFHSKCDKNPNTFIIIQSTNGNLFGGYTEQSWSGNGVKAIFKYDFDLALQYFCD